MNRTESYILEESRVCAPNYHPLPVVIERAKGVWMWDVEGKKYLDMMSAYSAVSHGHAHDKILKALNEQAAKLAMTSRAFHTDQLGSFLTKLTRLSGFEMGLPMNTGAEAVETALKAARRWGYRTKGISADQAEILVCNGNFHGRTTTIISFSSEPAYKADFGPLTSGFVEIPFGDADALKAAITPNTCAFLVEPIQGEAGIIISPEGYLKAIHEICTQHNVLLILDEIQSGLGRTGKMFAFEHEGIRPDGLILGKALGGGLLPVSVFLSSQEVLNHMGPGSHGSTFGGNPLACHVASCALDLLEEEGLIENSRILGEYFISELRKLNSPLIQDIRGRGLWIGLELKPELASARHMCEVLKDKGVLSKETHETTIRLAPPLVITKDEIDFALGAIRASLVAVEQSGAR